MDKKNIDKNAWEVDLLHADPASLVAHYQPTVGIIVQQFIRRGFFEGHEKMDIVQAVNTQLLEKKMGKMQKQFNGSVFLLTYFSKIVQNICVEMTRRRKKQPVFVEPEILLNVEEKQSNAFEKMAIQDELLRLEGLLIGWRKRIKTEFCLKLFARIILEEKDLFGLDTEKTKLKINNIKSCFYNNYETLTDKEIAEIVIPVFNIIENKKNDADSLRKWIYLQVEKIVKILNGDPPVYAYDREALKVLLRFYYEKRK